MDATIYGRGATFPFTIDTSGGIRESTGRRKIEEAIVIILGTQHGERVMRPTFGCNLKSLPFAPNNLQTATIAEHYVSEALQRWEPRIEVMAVDVVNPPGQPTLEITITYRIRATQDVHSLVYPFYLEQPQP